MEDEISRSGYDDRPNSQRPKPAYDCMSLEDASEGKEHLKHWPS